MGQYLGIKEYYVICDYFGAEMQINEFTRSLQVFIKEYLNIKYDKNRCSHNIEK